MQTTLYFVRHGRTPDKKKKHGQDESLSKEGFRQAARVANYFKSIKLDLIYSGTYRRAEEMARTLTNTLHKQNYQVIKDPLLNEIYRPDADNKPFTDKILQQYFLWRRDVVYNPTEEKILSQFMNRGESYWQFYQRCGTILKAFSNPQFSGKKIVVCTHSQVKVATKTWVSHGPNPSPSQLMTPFADRDSFPPFGSISTIVFDSDSNSWTIAQSNHIEHLK